MDRRGFLAALMGALAAPAGPAQAASVASEPLIPAGSAITVALDLWERPYTYLFYPGKLTIDRVFRVDTLYFQADADPLGEACAVELIVNGRALCPEPVRLAYVGLNPLFPFRVPIPVILTKGTEIEYRCRGGVARLVVHGSQFFTQAEMEAMPAEMDDDEEIDAEFVDEDDEEF